MTFDNVNTQANDVKDNTASPFHQDLPQLNFDQGNTLKFDQKAGSSALVNSGVLPSFDLHDDAVGGNGKGSAKDLTWANFEGASLITEKPPAAGQDGAPSGKDAAAGNVGGPVPDSGAKDSGSGQGGPSGYSHPEGGSPGYDSGSRDSGPSQGGPSVWSQFEGAHLITDPPAPEAQASGAHGSPSSAGGDTSSKSDSGSKDAGAGRPPTVWDTFEGQTLVTDPHNASGAEKTPSPEQTTNPEKTGGAEKTNSGQSAWDFLEGLTLVTDQPEKGGLEKSAVPSSWDTFEGKTLITDPPVVQPESVYRGKQ